MQLNFDKAIYNPKYYPLLFDQSRYLVLYGGAGSGKSEFAGQKILFRLLTETDHRIVVIRKVATTLRNSVFALLKNQIQRYGLGDLFIIRETEMKILCPNTNGELICIGLDDPEKIKSLSQSTIFWYEEPTELESKEFRQMSMRLRGFTKHYKQEILTFNPISEYHWLRQEFFPQPIEKALEKKGIARLNRTVKVGSEKIKFSATICHSTYRDNKFIDVEYKALLEDLKNKDYTYWLVYCMGKWGVLGNLVYEGGFETVKKFPAEFEETFYGLDFGYMHPTALIQVNIRDGKYYVKEKLYESKLTTTQLIAKIKSENLIENINDVIYADCAEPDRINELKEAGFHVKPAYKAKNSVKDGIDFIKSQEIYIHADSVNLNKEATTYKWREDKDGKPVEGEVVKIMDDALDAMRYAIFTKHKDVDPKFAFINRG